MRTTVSLDDDVAALIDAERRRSGETFREAINRLVRRGGQAAPATTEVPPLPLLPGKPAVDVRDTSEVLGEIDERYLAGKGIYGSSRRRPPR